MHVFSYENGSLYVHGGFFLMGASFLFAFVVIMSTLKVYRRSESQHEDSSTGCARSIGKRHI
jgi:hypothetical protein